MERGGDVVLAVGTNAFSGYFYFSGRTLGAHARLIHVDSAYSEVGKSEPTEVGIIADPKVALGQLWDAVEDTMSGSVREAAKGRAPPWRRKRRRRGPNGSAT